MKYQKIPALSGIELIKLLRKEGWIEHRQTNHGVALTKKISDRTKVTIIPKSKTSLPKGTLMAILGPKQTGIGAKGLLELLNRKKS